MIVEIVTMNIIILGQVLSKQEPIQYILLSENEFMQRVTFNNRIYLLKLVVTSNEKVPTDLYLQVVTSSSEIVILYILQLYNIKFQMGIIFPYHTKVARWSSGPLSKFQSTLGFKPGTIHMVSKYLTTVLTVLICS